ncbi:MAG TPA: ParB/RepB/Spo0J family partition protein [Deltaproteobacteria bacterium]|nr:ParB/RepB/Spo0J family partition protein [Deltaproteobacteria bacterium]
MPSGKSTPLGRGLDALLSDLDFPDVDQGQIFYCDIDLIHPNPYQPRFEIDEQELEILKESIARRGVLQPIIVTPKNGEYQILAGERRWRAAKKAGFQKVPVIARDADAKEQLFVALIENLQRKDLNCVEEAEAYRCLKEDFGLTQEEIAKQVGKKRATVANLLRLLSLPDKVLDYLRSDKLSMGHAKVLLALKNKGDIQTYAEKAIDEGLSVRALEKLIQEKTRKVRKRKIRITVYREQEKAVQKILGARVKIIKRGVSGKVVMEFPSEDEMKSLIQKLSELAR